MTCKSFLHHATSFCWDTPREMYVYLSLSEEDWMGYSKGVSRIRGISQVNRALLAVVYPVLPVSRGTVKGLPWTSSWFSPCLHCFTFYQFWIFPFVEKNIFLIFQWFYQEGHAATLLPLVLATVGTGYAIASLWSLTFAPTQCAHQWLHPLSQYRWIRENLDALRGIMKKVKVKNLI